MKMYYNVTNYRGDIAGVYQVVGNKLQRVQKLNYYPSGVLWSTSTNQGLQPYKYGEKELIQISGFDVYDNLARYYEPAIGRANSIDPHCESYYSLSPYAWCGNNFVNIIDPSGMDWYEAEDGSAIMWKEGSEEIEGYTRLGEEYQHKVEEYDENGEVTCRYTITYNQQDAVAITFIGATEESWVSQINEKINCYKACTLMLQSVGVETAGKEAEVLVTGKTSNGRAGDTNADASLGFVIINGVLESGKPIIVGVDYKNGSPNFDKMTDHFIVIASKTETLNNGKVTSTSYRFLDPGTKYINNGTSTSNQLKIENKRMVGTYNYGKDNQVYHYTVTTVRRNTKIK